MGGDYAGGDCAGGDYAGGDCGGCGGSGLGDEVVALRRRSVAHLADGRGHWALECAEEELEIAVLSGEHWRVVAGLRRMAWVLAAVGRERDAAHYLRRVRRECRERPASGSGGSGGTGTGGQG